MTTATKYQISAVIVGVAMVVAAVIMTKDTAPSGAQSAEKTPASFTSVSPDRFEELAETGEYTVIDIRTPEETVEGKVYADALEIDYYASSFRSELAKLDPDAKYLIYCRSGNRTGDTKKIMRSLGFQDVTDLKGGKVAWESSGRSLVLPTSIVADESVDAGLEDSPAVPSEEVDEANLIACPMDAKLCPDGTSVGRVGPNCEFAPCT